MSPEPFSHDRILQYRPPFVTSLPVQILLTGVILTLVTVLFLHLLFTAQYHWPLAPVNYVLQLSGVVTLLVYLCATLKVILAATLHESSRWPYMISYIAVNVPPFAEDDPDWSKAERATWLIMSATTSAFAKITHVQFLTLLFPSRLEKNLIFVLLGPLAVIVSAAQLVEFNRNLRVVSSLIRYISASTLSLVFTACVIVWGFFLNRRRAWRTEGGTAVFGLGTIFLALFHTTLNLVLMPHQRNYVWLQGLVWATMLWETYFAWWWWVGAGSGPEEMARKQRAKRKRETETTDPPTDPTTTSDERRWFERWWNSLQRAHVAAVRDQSAERQRKKLIPGWGLGSFAFRVDRDQEPLPIANSTGASRPKSVWYAGPLGRWRLRDTTVY